MVCSNGTCQLECQEELTDCGGVCADTQKDLDHCGACGNECGPGEACVGGSCELSCASDQTICEGECTDLLKSNEHCGACENACPSGQICSNGTCVLSCQQGLTECSGICTNLKTDPTSCGACGNICPAGQVCSDGQCALSCQTGLLTCAGKCVDLHSDNANCGACGNVCSEGHVCSDGSCQLTCQTGFVECGGVCTDPDADRDHCGATADCTGENAGEQCTKGFVCVDGECTLSCQQGLVNCGGTCIDPETDPIHCGAQGSCAGWKAGDNCLPGEVCSNGVCQLSCQLGLVNCGGTCIDPLENRNHCGAIYPCEGATAGEVCVAGQVCSAGSCQLSCQQGLVECDGNCIDPLADRDYCGASDGCTGEAAGTSCAPGEVCSGGDCQLSCQQGLVECNGTCIDPLADRNHCGASSDCVGGNAGEDCGAGEVCSAGVCALSCQQGLVECDGTCIDPSSNRTYCGASGSCEGAESGTACPQGQVCSNGSCSLSCQQGLIDCNGTCIDPQSNRSFCGASGDCAGDQAGEVCPEGYICANSECVVSCPSHQVNCNDTCIDPLGDAGYCGASGDCTGANAGEVCGAGEVCANGVCAVSCPTGQVNCFDACVNPDTDRNYCGADASCSGGQTCGSGFVCVNGACTVSCPSGQIACGGKCVDPLSDPAYCGASGDCLGNNAGTQCDPGLVCANGTCALSCPAPLINCGGMCVNPNSDPDHCGASGDCADPNAGDVCESGYVCNNGSCSLSCPSNLSNCSGVCTDTNFDPENCGGCGVACSTNHTSVRGCVDQVCYILGCQDDYDDCNGAASDGCEADLMTSASHCGQCDAPCNQPNQSTCSGGICVCDDGYDDCNGGTDGCETDLSNSEDNCGACGASCPSGMECENGTCQEVGCVPSCPSGQTCVSGECVGTGTLRFSLVWSVAGDVDLRVVTPNDKEISFENASPGDETDWGELDADDTSGTGPENVFWGDEEHPPPSGTYHVCANTYLDETRSYELTVENNGHFSTFTGTSPPGLWDTDCSTSSPGYVTSITFP